MANFSHPYVSRSEWGGPEAPLLSKLRYTTVTHLIIHHTAISREDEDWPKALMDIWKLHVTTRGWDDIGYNFVIDPNGVIYEGRAGGENVRGAHFICANENTMGIAVIGNFEETPPPQAAVSSLIELLAWKCREVEIDPLGANWHSATKLLLPNIAGHRDGNEAPSDSSACPVGTVCPGAFLYRLLPAIRQRVRLAMDDLLR
ncbi:MAG: N-acetylmuramoyl-L-alanine amidase [Acidobacteriota bacterium]